MLTPDEIKEVESIIRRVMREDRVPLVDLARVVGETEPISSRCPTCGEMALGFCSDWCAKNAPENV